MMILHIDQLQEPRQVHDEFQASQCNLPEEIGRFLTPIYLDAHIRKVAEEITIEGRITTHLELSCSRCLKVFDQYLDESFEVVYRPQPKDIEHLDEFELNEAELNVSYYTEETLSLSEMLREQLLLMLPVQPLCQAGCAGLCPSCGKDLNEGPCQCATEHIDPRLAVLGQLLHSEDPTQ